MTASESKFQSEMQAVMTDLNIDFETVSSEIKKEVSTRIVDPFMKLHETCEAQLTAGENVISSEAYKKCMTIYFKKDEDVTGRRLLQECHSADPSATNSMYVVAAILTFVVVAFCIFLCIHLKKKRAVKKMRSSMMNALEQMRALRHPHHV